MAAEREALVSADDLLVINRILLDGCDVRIVRVPNGVKIQSLRVKTMVKNIQEKAKESFIGTAKKN